MLNFPPQGHFARKLLPDSTQKKASCLTIRQEASLKFRLRGPLFAAAKRSFAFVPLLQHCLADCWLGLSGLW